MLRAASAITGAVKYCHAEVGYIDRIESSDPELDGKRVEQYELEIDLAPVEDLGCWLPVLRWLVREVANRHGASVTFVPKLDEGMAGSGMHLHLALARDGQNVMRGPDGDLSPEARGLIGGLLAPRRAARSPSATPWPGASCAWCRARRRRPGSAGAAATAPRWCGCRSTSRPRSASTGR